MSDIMNEYADVCKERNALKAENAGWLEKSSYCMSTHMAQIESLKAALEKVTEDRDRWADSACRLEKANDALKAELEEEIKLNENSTPLDALLKVAQDRDALKAKVEKLRNQPIYGPSVLESLMVIEKDRDRWKSKAERYEVLAERAREKFMFIRDYTYTDAEGPELRGQNERVHRMANEFLKSFDDKCHICGDIEDKSICSRCKPVDDKGPKKTNNLTYEDTL